MFFCQFEIIINVLVSSFRFILILMGLRPLEIFLLLQCGDLSTDLTLDVGI